MSNISSEMRLSSARESGNEVWKLDELMEVIKSEVEAREMIEGTRVGQHKQSSHDSVHPESPINQYLPSALVSNDFMVWCVYCEGSHYSASCDKVRAVTDHRDILTKAGKCFDCLRPNHKVKDYCSTRTCRFYNRKHHQSICMQQPIPSSSNEVKYIQQAASTVMMLQLIVALSMMKRLSYCKQLKLSPQIQLVDSSSQCVYYLIVEISVLVSQRNSVGS